MLVFLDLETTGLLNEDRLCSLAFMADDVLHHELIKPPKKLKPEAMSVHHITNEMLQDKKGFEHTSITSMLQILNVKENVLVTHDARFVISMLEKESFVWQGDFIDTKKVTAHLIPECEQFSLQFLRYELRLYRKESVLAQKYHLHLCAHDAASDLIHIRLLFEYLLELADIQKQIELSASSILLEKMPFGKYRGTYLESLCRSDPAYCQWLLSQENLDEDLRYSIEHYGVF